jgi:hypothetical protein
LAWPCCGKNKRPQAASGCCWAGWGGEEKVSCSEYRVTSYQSLSKTYLCGWRQLRNLLQDGEGLYWQRDEERIWLRSAAKVAYGLGVARLSGRPVALPLEVRINGIGRFRAELYAAFHSGRVKTTPDGKEQVSPIARETLANLSGVGETMQRRYEEQLSEVETAVEVQPNYAIGNKTSARELEDFRGRQGPKGEQYVAWQLPNSYTGSHRQRRINQVSGISGYSGSPSGDPKKRRNNTIQKNTAIASQRPNRAWDAY